MPGEAAPEGREAVPPAPKAGILCEIRDGLGFSDSRVSVAEAEKANRCRSSGMRVPIQRLKRLKHRIYDTHKRAGKSL